MSINHNENKNIKKRTEKMAEIEKHAKELLGDVAYNDYINIVKSLCKKHTDDNPEGFDYILLIDRKGSSIFRCFLRIIKEEFLDKREGGLKEHEEFLKNLPVIITSRHYGCYDFGGAENISNKRVVIFDDIINKARNLEQYVSNLYRRGIKNIHFSAFAFCDKLLKMSTRNNAVIKYDNDKKETYFKFIYDDDYKNEADKGFFTKAYEKNPNFRVPILRLENSYLIKQGYKRNKPTLYANRNFFVPDAEAKDLSYCFNNIIHFSLTPYTAYLSYARFNCELFKRDNFKEYAHKDLNVRAYKSKDKNNESFLCYKNDYNHENGYFSGIRIFENKDTREILIHPTLFLPPLKEDQVEELYDKLGFNEFSIDGVKPLNYEEFEKIKFNNPHDLSNYIRHLERKNKLESAERRIIALLSAIDAIRFINIEKDVKRVVNISFKEDINLKDIEALDFDTYILKGFAKSLCRYFLADYLKGDKEQRNVYLNYMIEFLSKSIKIVENNEELFNFKNTEKYSAKYNLLEDYTNVIRDKNKIYSYKAEVEKLIKEEKDENKKKEYEKYKKRIIKNIKITEENIICQEKEETKKYQFIKRVKPDKINDSKEDKIDDIFGKIIKELELADDSIIDHKLNPLPIIEVRNEIINLISEFCEKNKKEAFLEVVAYIDSCVANGIMSTCSYAESKSYCREVETEENDYMIISYVQRGELASIIWEINFAKRFNKVFGNNLVYCIEKVTRLLKFHKNTINNSEEKQLKECFYKQMASIYYEKQEKEKLIFKLKKLRVEKKNLHIGSAEKGNPDLSKLVSHFDDYLDEYSIYKDKGICFQKYMMNKEEF